MSAKETYSDPFYAGSAIGGGKRVDVEYESADEFEIASEIEVGDLHVKVVEPEAGADKPDSAKAADILQRSAELLIERGKQYDTADGRSSMDRAVAAFNAITGHSLTEAEGWLLMQCVKDARQWARGGYHADSAEDCIAFAALKAVAKQAYEQER